MNDSDWACLPAEILQLIFSHVSKRDLFHCQLTCKTWFRPSQRHFYKDVFLKYKGQANKYIATLSKSQELGSLAESIHLHHVFLPQFFSASSDRFDVLSSLATLCPNVKYLNTSDTNNELFKNLLPLYQSGHFLHLKTIPIPKGWAVFRDYIQCALAMRDKLTRLTIGDATNRQCYFDDVFRDDYMDQVIGHLAEFRHLRELSFIKHTDHCLFEFDDIIELCPQLEAFGFTTYSLKRVASEGLFSYAGDDVYTTVDLTAIQPRPSIRKLMGNFLLMSDETIRYIMHKFPQLQSLEINTNKEDHQLLADIKTRGFDLSPDLMTTFLTYLFALPSAKFHNLYLQDAVGFLSNFLQTHHFPGTIEITYQALNNRSLLSADNPMLHIDNNSTNTTNCKLSVVFERANQYEKALVREQDGRALPHMALLDAAGANVHNLSLCNVNQKVFGNTLSLEDSSITGCLVDYTLMCCPYLKSLALSNCWIAHCSSSSQVANKSVERLALNGCTFDSQNLTNMLCAMPTLKHLSLIDCCTLNNSTDTTATARTIFVNMPFAPLETLLYTNAKELGSLSKICLKVTTYAAGTAYYRIQSNYCVRSSAKNYHDMLGEPSLLHLDVHCKSIKTISVGFDSHHIVNCCINQ